MKAACRRPGCCTSVLYSQRAYPRHPRDPCRILTGLVGVNPEPRSPLPAPSVTMPANRTGPPAGIGREAGLTPARPVKIISASGERVTITPPTDCDHVRQLHTLS